jgi:hypothetical protein
LRFVLCPPPAAISRALQIEDEAPTTCSPALPARRCCSRRAPETSAPPRGRRARSEFSIRRVPGRHRRCLRALELCLGVWTSLPEGRLGKQEAHEVHPTKSKPKARFRGRGLYQSLWPKSSFWARSPKSDPSWTSKSNQVQAKVRRLGFGLRRPCGGAGTPRRRRHRRHCSSRCRSSGR